MGLDDVEIFMEVEEAFWITLPESRKLATVKDVEDIACELAHTSDLDEIIKRVPENGPDGHIPFEQYLTFWKENPFLPNPRSLLRKRKYKRTDILEYCNANPPFRGTDNEIRTKVRQIIQSQLNLKQPIKSSDHLYDDLGCG